MRTRKVIACAVLAAALASASTPVAAREADFGTRKAADSAVQGVEIGVGVTAGVLALVGGAVWYYVHHHRSGVEDVNPGAQAPPAPQN